MDLAGLARQVDRDDPAGDADFLTSLRWLRWDARALSTLNRNGFLASMRR